MIGNDIVDLDLAKTESNWQREGFLKKQFTKLEQVLISNAKDSFEMVWLLWSMKEAAYKIWVQQNKERVFAPIKFECELLKLDQGIVKYKDHIYYSDSMINESFIHTIALLEKKAEVYSQIGSPHGIDAAIKKKLAEITGFSVDEISQRKSIKGVPSYYHKKQKLIKSCSISHHGNYGAFSLLSK